MASNICTNRLAWFTETSSPKTCLLTRILGSWLQTSILQRVSLQFTPTTPDRYCLTCHDRSSTHKSIGILALVLSLIMLQSCGKSSQGLVRSDSVILLLWQAQNASSMMEWKLIFSRQQRRSSFWEQSSSRSGERNQQIPSTRSWHSRARSTSGKSIGMCRRHLSSKTFLRKWSVIIRRTA